MSEELQAAIAELDRYLNETHVNVDYQLMSRIRAVVDAGKPEAQPSFDPYRGLVEATIGAARVLLQEEKPEEALEYLDRFCNEADELDKACDKPEAPASDGSGCDHAEFVKSFRFPTSRECKQCGKLELYCLKVKVRSLESDKKDLLSLIASLQDRIAAQPEAPASDDPSQEYNENWARVYAKFLELESIDPETATGITEVGASHLYIAGIAEGLRMAARKAQEQGE